MSSDRDDARLIHLSTNEKNMADSDEERRLASFEEGDEEEEHGEGSEGEDDDNEAEQHALVEPAFSKEGFLSK